MAYSPIYILVLVYLILIDYISGIYIERFEGRKRKWFLLLSLGANIGTLVIFKYATFLNIPGLFAFFNINTSQMFETIILPIGLSFHTFQSLSYVLEVYKKKQKAEKNLLTYSLYVMFYPQLVAGPIERPQHLLPQLKVLKKFDYMNAKEGLRLMLWGFFKKMVIADRLAVFVNPVYANPESYDYLTLILATYFFAFQIYCDFSGYSDIAIGAARVMGINLSQNFNFPYLSRSLPEFWRRWHISLSSWFRDYIYIPLGGNKVPLFFSLINIMTVFILSGLWHGAGWNFFVWGVFHGCGVALTVLLTKLNLFKSYLETKNKLLIALQIFITFNILCVSWIFFRATSLESAYFIISKIFTGLSQLFFVFPTMSFDIGDVIIVVFLIFFMEIIQYLERNKNFYKLLDSKPVYVRWCYYYLLLFALIFLGEYTQSKFIYFQF